MSKKQNKFEFASEEVKTKYLNDIIGFFQDQRGEQIGLLAAAQILDFFIQTTGDEIYAKGINDCKKLIKEKSTDLEVELNLLLP